MRIDSNSQAYEWLRDWIANGCRWSEKEELPSDDAGGSEAERLANLEVLPAKAIFAPQCRTSQLIVLATFADGTKRDVTRWARFEPSVVSGIDVSDQGRVSVNGPLDTSISVSYLTGRCATRLTFLPESSQRWQAPAAPQPLDEIVERQLERMRIVPTEIADDSVFLRRVFLVVVGRLPTVSEVREFLASSEPDKRERLIERLLNDSGYAALWALRWSDLLRNEQKVMSPEGASRWHAWIAQQVASDRPVNEFVAEMITTIGSTYEHPPAAFHRTHRDPETAAESIGQVFLGVRLQCARCHNHPFDRWRQDDYYGLAAYFATIERKQIGNDPKDKFDKHIISGDEVISLSDKAPSINHPGRATNVPPKPLTQDFVRDVDLQSKSAAPQPLEALANWLTIDNRMFARNIANRIVYQIMGRGIVDPPDDFRDSNPASNPELLEYLTDELIRSDYSVRHVSRLILHSRMFSRAAVDDLHRDGLDVEANFGGYPLRRMPAEVLLDALSDVTKVAGQFDEDAAATTSKQRAVARPEIPKDAGFLTTFGKPNRLLVCECERSNSVSLGQSLMLINGSEMRSKLSESGTR